MSKKKQESEPSELVAGSKVKWDCPTMGGGTGVIVSGNELGSLVAVDSESTSKEVVFIADEELSVIPDAPKVPETPAAG